MLVKSVDPKVLPPRAYVVAEGASGAGSGVTSSLDHGSKITRGMLVWMDEWMGECDRPVKKGRVVCRAKSGFLPRGARFQRKTHPFALIRVVSLPPDSVTEWH